MKKGFVSLKAEMFTPLKREQIPLVFGGGDTEGRSYTTRTESRNVLDPKTGLYHWVNQNYVRSYTSDAVGEDGVVCYWGETYQWVNA